MIEAIGWLANMLFAITGAPDVIKSFRNKTPPGMTWFMLIIWFSAEIFSAIYIGVRDYGDEVYHLPMYVSYLFGFILVTFLIIFKRRYKDGPRS